MRLDYIRNLMNIGPCEIIAIFCCKITWFMDKTRINLLRTEYVEDNNIVDILKIVLFNRK